jgi:hypothetical protein
MECFALMRKIRRMSTSRILAVVFSSCKQLDEPLERKIFETRNLAKVLVEPSDDSTTRCSPTVCSVTIPRPHQLGNS